MTRRESILREMGLAPLWKRRGAEEQVEEAVVPPGPPVAALVQSPVPVAPVPRPPALRPPAAAPVPVRPSILNPAVNTPSSEVAVTAGMDWEELRQATTECRACGLCQKRRQAVFGVGDRQADWLLVGEGPGAEEDEKGEPFVGQAGKLLDAMLAAISLKRGEDVYIANTVKCRPPGNRTPEPEEMAACFPYLERQIALIKPRLIIALGRPAAQTLLGQEVKIGAVRGKLLEFRGIPLIVTYHPAYLLRNLHDKALTWEDLCFARRTMAGLKNEEQRP